MAKQHLPQAHHWVPLARLFSSLRGRVLSQSDNCASKLVGIQQDFTAWYFWTCSKKRTIQTGPFADEKRSEYQVLRKAKTSIQKLEQTLCSLLKMKASCSLEDGSPSSLEEVREEYVRRQFGSHSTTSASEDMSESDSAIWYLLQESEKQTPEEYGKPELIQFSDSLSPDLVEFERSAFASCTSENPEDHQRLYLQVTDFLKQLFSTNTQFCQEEDLHYDHETVMLRCTETFDDEDF